MRFCWTVSQGKTEPCCEMTMPFGLGPLRATPPTRTLPSSGCRNPAMMFINVDLPQPEGPTIATNSPSATEKLTPSTTGKAVPLETKLFFRFSTTIFLSDITPPDGLEPFEQAHRAIERAPDQADDEHPGDHQ